MEAIGAAGTHQKHQTSDNFQQMLENPKNGQENEEFERSPEVVGLFIFLVSFCGAKHSPLLSDVWVTEGRIWHSQRKFVKLNKSEESHDQNQILIENLKIGIVRTMF